MAFNTAVHESTQSNPYILFLGREMKCPVFGAGWVVPRSLWAMLLQYYHDGTFAEHLGERKTFAKIASNFWWPGMRVDVFKYVQG